MRRRPALPAACAALVLVVAQLLALAHQADTRHVVCAEHGEELEAATLAQPLHACDDDHLVGIEDEGGEHHDDCLVLRALHQGSQAPATWVPPVLVTIETTTTRSVPRSFAAARALYRVAPKTSPPVHA